MDKVTVSVIINTYNRPELFKRALLSVINQTYKDYEIIVVDDCSDKPYEHTIIDTYIRHKTNKGLSASRNTGIKVAKGKYIVTLDDDNELHKDYLKSMIPFLEEKPREAVSCGRVIRYKNFDDLAHIKVSPFTAIDWGWLIKREVFDEILYDEDLRANEDTDFGIQFFKKGFRAGCIQEPLTIAYDTPNSLSFPDGRELNGMWRFFIKNNKEYESHPNELRCLYRIMGRKFYRGQKQLGINFFWLSFKAKPCLNSFLNLVFIHFGWYTYDKFMTLTEYVGSYTRRRS